MKPFETTTYGKWILAGEHAVLRGSPALAFPLLSRSLRLKYTPSERPLTVQFGGSHGEELQLLFYGVIENALSRLQISEPLTGHFELISDLPVGGGLGASAALCGAVARWCEGQGWICMDEVYEFARGLEDLFHGESSGVDLAVSLSKQGIRFVRGGDRIELKPQWWPRLFLSYTGRRGMTSECVTKVKGMFETSRELAERLDLRMRESVTLAERALKSSDPQEGLPLLVRAFELARDCFERWSLTEGDVGRHMQMLDRHGALAVKPTGSGGGGYILSLWENEPPESLRTELVPVPGF